MKNVEVIKATSNITNRAFSKTLDRTRVAAYCRVSTDSEDQLNSYKSQVQYYTDYITEKAEWVLVDIYADDETSYGGIPKSPQTPIESAFVGFWRIWFLIINFVIYEISSEK